MRPTIVLATHVLLVLTLIGCGGSTSEPDWTLTNTSAFWLNGTAVHVPIGQLDVTTGPPQVTAKGIEIPSQSDDLDGDGTADELFFLVDLPPDTTVLLEIGTATSTTQYAKRTQALLAVRDSGRFDETGAYVDGTDYRPVRRVAVPPEQEQDSDWAMFEGPVWESDLVGFRYYLDDRNRTDVFGKSVAQPVLHEVEGDYHAVSEWGADVLKVGESLGIGSPAAYLDSGPAVIDNTRSTTVEIVADGPLRSIIRTTYDGWEVDGRVVDVISDMEIHAGQRWTEQTLRLAGETEGLLLATGVVRHPEAEPAITGIESGVFFLYTWGRQSDQGDVLGMAILVPDTFGPEHNDDDALTHLVTLVPADNQVTYRYLAAWERESDPIPDAEAFEETIRQVARTWNADTQVSQN